MGIRDGVGRRLAAAAGATDRVVEGVMARARESLADGDWVRSAIESVPPPAVPVDAPWELSLEAMVRQAVPAKVRWAARALDPLDEYGAVRLGTESAGFDGDDHDWADVAELGTRGAFEVLTTDALEREIDRIRHLFPPVPGRRALVGMAASALAVVVLAAAERAAERPFDRVDVPCELVYRRRFRGPAVARGGLFATAVLALRPDVAGALTATAAAHGIPLRHAQRALPPEAAHRVATLRDRTTAVNGLLARLDDDEPADCSRWTMATSRQGPPSVRPAGRGPASGR